MNDLDIRRSLLDRFMTRSVFESSSVLEEVSVSNGCARADVVFAGKKLECFEWPFIQPSDLSCGNKALR